MSPKAVWPVSLGRESMAKFPWIFFGRHSMAENLSNGTHNMLKQMNREKLDINEIRILLNHESVDMSQSYLKNRDDEIIENLFGVN